MRGVLQNGGRHPRAKRRALAAEGAGEAGADRGDDGGWAVEGRGSKSQGHRGLPKAQAAQVPAVHRGEVCNPAKDQWVLFFIIVKCFFKSFRNFIGSFAIFHSVEMRWS